MLFLLQDKIMSTFQPSDFLGRATLQVRLAVYLGSTYFYYYLQVRRMLVPNCLDSKFKQKLYGHF